MTAVSAPSAADAPAGNPLWTFGFALIPAGITAGLLLLLPAVSAGQAVELVIPWVPSLGISAGFRVDALGLLFALMIAGIGTFVFLYAAEYMRGYANKLRFFILLTLFMVSMLGVVLADNLILMFVFWEMTTITSFLLIGFSHNKAVSRQSALQGLLVTGAGGLALLAGLLLLGIAAGSFDVSTLLADDVDVRTHGLYTAVLVLVLIGAFTKSAQFPLHFWLPNAMAAPTPVSAYLHSATMVKAGVYLLARLHPVLGGTDAWLWSLTIFGSITAVLSAIWALQQTDLKQMLAYTTVMALGTLVMFLGSGSEAGVAAAVTFLVVHALYKSSLFMVVGAIDHATGTRDRDRLSGLRRGMPIIWLIAVGAGFSMAGFPPFLGFIGKELKYEGALAVASEPWLVAAAAVLANACMVATAGLICLKPFLGSPGRFDGTPHDPPAAMLIGPLLLAAAGLATGIAPEILGTSLVGPAVQAVWGDPVVVKLKLWHGINLPLMLSLLTFAAGLAIYRYRETLRGWLTTLAARLPVTAEGAYDHAIAGFKRAAAVQTALLQTGRLSRYVSVIAMSMAGLLVLALIDGGTVGFAWVPLLHALASASLLGWTAFALIAVAVPVIIWSRSRLTCICSLGAVGVAVALLFLLHGALDVALTQLLVEILFVVLLALVLVRMPRLNQGRKPRVVRRIAAVNALAVGGLVTLTLLAILNQPFDGRVTDFFEAKSVPEGYGRNIVNVILVDFRALDTLGEIAVVAAAFLAAVAVLRIFRSAGVGPADGVGTGRPATGTAPVLPADGVPAQGSTP